ncbi:serine/threonine-protein kinase [Adhaeretor mobilis]|uniref:Serine/threonine-protein kinase PknB n=1 Tax=Adhaeretor mobilis TaxID=1930276 RepID=A0A517MRF0_9BACT|nr:serine/threonine-protein kinase [Adhaeretor mobilis]QDS97448.1 Serine/threonine-protein kinase PknB [Adhaeretor mobilis]
MTALDHPAHEMLSDYALGRLPADELDEIAEHLQQCDDCQETLTSLAGEDTLVRGLAMANDGSPYEAEADLQAVLAKLQETEPPEETHDLPEKQSAGGPAGSLGQLREYRLLEKLGCGGMGTVYRAEHQKLGRMVAVKVLPEERMRHPEAIARFHREMQAIGNLDHPHIVRAFDAGESEGKHFLAMELIDGVDLGALVKREGPLRVGTACELVRQAAIGLQYAHDQGLVHRDVKPSNLMLDKQGKVKVLDLGLARLLTDAPEESARPSVATGDFQRIDASLTGTDQVMGTPDFMAPEQCTGGRIDGRSDVFSLGATLYKLLTGKAPYSGSQYDTLAKKIAGLAERAVPRVTEHRQDLPKRLVAVLDRMLAKDPKQRFESPAAASEALAPFADVCGLVALNPEDANATDDHLVKASPEPLAALPPRRAIPGWTIAAAAFGIVLLAALLLKLRTPEGQLTVEVPPEALDQVQVEVRQGNQVEVMNLEEGWEAKLLEGQWDVTLKNAGDQFRLDKDRVTIERGEQQLVRIMLDREKSAVGPTSGNSGQGTLEVADHDRQTSPERSDFGLDCTLYTKAYEIDDAGRIDLGKKLRWQVRSEYRGHTARGPVVDPRITIALVDDEKSFWPIIAKLSLDEAIKLHESLTGAVDELEKQTIEDDPAKPLTASMILQSYEPDDIGRVELPSRVRLQVSWAPAAFSTNRFLGLGIWDVTEESLAFYSKMSLLTASRLTEQLGRTINAKKRTVAVKRPDPKVLATFEKGKDKTITQDEHAGLLGAPANSWEFRAKEAKTIRLFEIDPSKLEPPRELENCIVTYRAKLKTKDATGKVYLEMWCRVPPGPASFSKGFHHAVTGTNGWANYETPFFLKKGEKADQLKLNIVTEGSGTVSVKDVEVIVAPMP